MPYSSQSFRRDCMYLFGGTTSPESPWIGSITMAAVSSGGMFVEKAMRICSMAKSETSSAVIPGKGVR